MDAKATRAMAAELTTDGAKLFDLLQVEQQQREVRTHVVTRPGRLPCGWVGRWVAFWDSECPRRPQSLLGQSKLKWRLLGIQATGLIVFPFPKGTKSVSLRVCGCWGFCIFCIFPSLPSVHRMSVVLQESYVTEYRVMHEKVSIL